MTAPTPLYGSNPYVGAYQNSQFDAGVTGGASPWSLHTPLDALQNPPSAGITAEASPAVEFAEATNPTPGANDDEPAHTNPGLDTIYPDNPEGIGPSNP
jgi:hypothetical protein